MANDSTSSGFTNVASYYKPVWSWNGRLLTDGEVTTPGIARGALINTGVYITNSQIAHVCDFKFNLTVDLSLSSLIPNLGIIAGAIKNGQNAAAAAIRVAMSKLNQLLRVALDTILSGLNLDLTGVISANFSGAKQIVREINEKLKEIAQVVADVAMVYYLIQSIEEITNWIKNLPEEISRILTECLTSFTTSVGLIKEQVAGTLNEATSKITIDLQNSLYVDESKSPEPGIIATVITDPINSKLDGLTSMIRNSVDSGQATASNNFGQKSGVNSNGSIKGKP